MTDFQNDLRRALARAGADAVAPPLDALRARAQVRHARRVVTTTVLVVVGVTGAVVASAVGLRPSAGPVGPVGPDVSSLPPSPTWREPPTFPPDSCTFARLRSGTPIVTAPAGAKSWELRGYRASDGTVCLGDLVDGNVVDGGPAQSPDGTNVAVNLLYETGAPHTRWNVGSGVTSPNAARVTLTVNGVAYDTVTHALPFATDRRVWGVPVRTTATTLEWSIVVYDAHGGILGRSKSTKIPLYGP